MTTLETILTRAMNDRAFADALVANPEKALAEYDLPAEEVEKFKNISRAQFEGISTEERLSMSVRPATRRAGRLQDDQINGLIKFIRTLK